MRKFLLRLLFAVVAAWPVAYGQTNTFAALELDQTWTGKQQMPIQAYTVATLPASTRLSSRSVAALSLIRTHSSKATN